MKKISLLILFGFIIVVCSCGRSGPLYLPNHNQPKQADNGKYDF
jgi:predicted small lipoprotein YifL